jgi:negative regulator of replication initiation
MLSKSGNVHTRLSDVIRALALTGGHARTIEVMMASMLKSGAITNSDIEDVVGKVRSVLAKMYGNRQQSVQRWFVASLLAAKFRLGALDRKHTV